MFSRSAGGLVILLGMLSVAPAFAAVDEWSAPVDLSATGGNANYPQVAVDASGNSIAVWDRYNGSVDIIQASRSADGGVTWSTPVDLSAPGGWAYSSHVAVDAAGNAVAVWSRYNGSNTIIQSSRSTDGGVTWSTPMDLSAAGRNAESPRISVDDSGSAIVLWLRSDGSNSIIQSSRSADGGVTWSTPVDLSAAGQDASGPTVAADGLGNAVAVWRRNDGSNRIVQSSRSADGGVTWSTPVDLSAAGQDASGPTVAADGLGNAVAVWYRNDGSNRIVQSSRSADGGMTWSAPVNLSAAGRDAYSSAVAVGGSGDAVAVWYRDDGVNDIVQSSRSADGGVTWSTPVDLSAAGQDASDPTVAADGLGNAVAVWRRNDGSNRIVQSSRSADGGVTWSTPVDLSEAGQNANHHQVAADESGDAVAIWYRSNGGNDIIQVSRSSAINGGGGGGGEELADTGAGGSAGDTALIASAGLLALGVLTRVVMRRRGVANLG